MQLFRNKNITVNKMLLLWCNYGENDPEDWRPASSLFVLTVEFSKKSKMGVQSSVCFTSPLLASHPFFPPCHSPYFYFFTMDQSSQLQLSKSSGHHVLIH